jgi:hypothetical protein
MRRESFYAGRNRSGDLLHIETDGCIINIEVGLHDRDGRQVTSVRVSPDGDTGTGCIWVQEGSRVVQLLPGETRLPADPSALSEAELACLATTAVELWEESSDRVSENLSSYQEETLAKAAGFCPR